MQRTLGIFLFTLHLTVATVGRCQDTPKTPEQQFQLLLKEYNSAPAIGTVTSDAKRLEYVGQIYKHRNAVTAKMVALIEKHPNSPIALGALIHVAWRVNTMPWPVELVGEDSARPKAFQLILRDHIGSEKIAALCPRVSHGFAEEYETFLRAVLSKNPHRNAQAMACYSLGHFLNNRGERLQLCKETPTSEKEFAGLFGKEYLSRLYKQDGAKVKQEIETLLLQAQEKYGDVKFPEGDTIADRAKTELFGIRHLNVGCEAPDIEGEDEDGKRFKLSDYRGKVVLLDFWSFA